MCIYERNCSLLLLWSALKQLFHRICFRNFNSTFDSFRNYISLVFLFEQGFLEGALPSELVTPTFAERFKAAIWCKSY